MRIIQFHGRDSAFSILMRQTITLLYTIVVVPALLITLHGQICNAQTTMCNRNFNYTKGGEFETNLNTVLNALVQHTSQTGFNTSVSGPSTNRVYGLLNCRGDSTADQCYNCSQRANTTIRQSQSCGNAVGGRIWMDVCFLRYENYSFFGKLDTNGLYTYITTTVSSPDVFNGALQNLLGNLSAEATSGSKLFASGTIRDSLSRRIYGLVQCWKDISSTDDCNTCLSNAINYIFTVYSGTPEAQGLMGSCIVRYEMYSFFNSTALPPSPAASPAEAPHTPPMYGTTPTSESTQITPLADHIVLNDLVQHASQIGFTTSEYGQSPDQIYGLLQCRGDTTFNQCYSCSQEAHAAIRQHCRNAVGGRIWFDFCFLHYANYSFIGQLDTTGHYAFSLKDPQNVSNVEVFNVALDKLFNNLLSEIETGSIYASGTAKDGLSRDIYGLVQCWRDMSIDNCTTCLTEIKNNIFASYAGKPGAQGLIGSCIVRYDINRFFNLTAPRSLLAPNTETNTPPKQNTPSKNSSNKRPIILSLVGGLLLVLFVCLFATRRRLKSAIFRRGYEGQGQVEEDTLFSEDRQIMFKMETLLTATGHFRDENKIGEGGFGPVYKGTIHNGKDIAVKKLSLNSMQGKKEFLNEVELVAKIQHRNLVKLLGCCSGGSETLLVYEYLPNKSLDKIIFDPNKRKHLDWEQRYNIIIGVARGLLYLHQDSKPRIIHRDIKASNILLDEKLNPKIADFGLAKHFPEDQSHISTRVAGTYGYMAPEYAMQGQLTVKADVYSFGILLLELITGRKNTDYTLSVEMQILLGWAWRSYERGNIAQMIDPTIIETCEERQALRCIHVGLLCIQADSSLRPPMSTVNLMLSTYSITLPDPTKPAFFELTSSGSGSGLSHVLPDPTKPAFFELTSSGSGSGLSHVPAPVAPPSNAVDSVTDLVPR